MEFTEPIISLNSWA